MLMLILRIGRMWRGEDVESGNGVISGRLGMVRGRAAPEGPYNKLGRKCIWRSYSSA
jgi:hypothetical protein